MVRTSHAIALKSNSWVFAVNEGAGEAIRAESYHRSCRRQRFQVSVAELNLLEWPPYESRARAMVLAAREHPRPRQRTVYPQGRDTTFGGLKPSFRDDHSFRFELRFGSFNRIYSLQTCGFRAV